MRLIEVSKKELRDLYKKKKLSTYKISGIYNCCQATIWKRLRQFGIKPRFPWNTVNLSKKKLSGWYIKKKLSTWQIEKRYGYSRGTVYRKLCEYNIKRRSSATAHIIYPRRNFNRNKIDEAYLIGFAMGDLRVRKVYSNSQTIHVDCGSTKKEQINLIKELFRPYGRIWISKPNKVWSTQIECFLNDSFNFLLKKRILADRWILKKKKYFAAFLAGFTDAEGCISVSKQGQAFFSLGNYNYKLLGQIRNELMNIGIHCGKLIEGKTKGKRFGKQKYMHNQNYWQISIHAKLSLLNFFNLVDPYLKHHKRIEDMRRARQNIRLRNEKYANINMNL